MQRLALSLWFSYYELGVVHDTDHTQEAAFSALLHAVAACGAAGQLRELDVEATNAPDLEMTPALARTLRSLRALRLRCHYCCLEVQSPLQAACPALEHLALECTYSASFAPGATGLPPLLTRLELNFGLNEVAPGDPTYDALLAQVQAGSCFVECCNAAWLLLSGWTFVGKARMKVRTFRAQLPSVRRVCASGMASPSLRPSAASLTPASLQVQTLQRLQRLDLHGFEPIDSASWANLGHVAGSLVWLGLHDCSR